MTGSLMHTPSSPTLPPTPPVPRALIADDQPDVLTALRLLLRNAGYQTEAVSSPAEVLEAIRQSNFDLVLMDLNYARDTTSGQEGLDLITNIRALDSALPIVVLTAWGSVELAVEVMHRGGRDFVQKPWDNSRLLKSLDTQIKLGRKKRQRRLVEAESQTVRDKLQHELEEAREIQAALMPRALPEIDGFDIALGGDYFDILKFSEHPPMLIRDGACMRMKDGGPVLGIFPDRRYVQGAIDLRSGDCLVLYTDGVTEARGAFGREFGEDRLEALLKELLTGEDNLQAADLRDRITGAVDEFSEGEVYDDATLMVVRVE